MTPTVFALLHREDIRKVRVKELRRVLGKTNCIRGQRKNDLVENLRRNQVARRFCRLTMQRRRWTAASKLQKWWRQWKRYIPMNAKDPITLDTWSETEANVFTLVLSRGTVCRYNADALFKFMHLNLLPAEPLSRYILSLPELGRLDKLVSLDLMTQYGSSRQLFSPDTISMKRRQTQHNETLAYLECELDAIGTRIHTYASGALVVPGVLRVDTTDVLLLNVQILADAINAYTAMLEQYKEFDKNMFLAYTTRVMKNEQCRNRNSPQPQKSVVFALIVESLQDVA